MDDQVEDAVAHQHRLLAEWLGSRADQAVLAELRAAHTADFTLVTIDGEVLDRDTLFAALEAAAGAQPGLRIDITDVTVVARLEDALLVRFLETHLRREQATARRVTALLRSGEGPLRWAYVHETTALR
ncbi:MAG TPA: DUF4440 domain-containing protein [Amycolatopsis sp.]|nr:DUF4440 domain-containing protein [Amycolatopsis sp.]